MAENHGNAKDKCAVCESRLDGYRPLQHLPPAWVLLLSEEHDLQEWEWNTAFVQLCSQCAERFDYLKVNSWKVTEPEALDDATTEWALRIKPDDLIDI